MMSPILTLSLFALFVGPSQTAAHNEGVVRSGYAAARDRAHGAAIDKARQVIQARVDEYPGLSVAVGQTAASSGRRGSVGPISKAASACGPLRDFASGAWPSRCHRSSSASL